MWDLAAPGIEPMSPALVGGFFTTEPPGKLFLFSYFLFFLFLFFFGSATQLAGFQLP